MKNKGAIESMNSVASVAAYGVYVTATMLLAFLYFTLRRVKLRARAVEAGFEVKEPKWYEMWIPAQMSDKRSRILEAILGALPAILLAIGWWHWSVTFTGILRLLLAGSLIVVLPAHLAAAVISYWMERWYSSH